MIQKMKKMKLMIITRIEHNYNNYITHIRMKSFTIQDHSHRIQYFQHMTRRIL